MSDLPPALSVCAPDWLLERLAGASSCASDFDRMRWVIGLARANVEHGTGGPFAAAVFERGGRFVAAGVNSVQRLNNSCLHAEVMALMFAQARLGTFALRKHSPPDYEFISSCDPCAMCLGAVLWGGVRRLVCGADKADAEQIGFDEGPVSAESFRHLERRGIEVVRGVLRAEAAAVLNLYAERGGEVYNG
jgi:tRNA(Arg) A34 adenosine deaminase TadA